MLFEQSRVHFFRPLIGKYRGQVADCLGHFYARLYGEHADYSRSFTRDQVVEVFEEAVARSPVLDEDEAEAVVAGPRSGREQAGWILHLVLEHGWLERHVDAATLQTTYAFSRQGRLFTQPMVEAAGGRFRTRHRNTRNTRNALKSFVDKGEVYDLLDAYEYSERIVADFSDLIAELDERRRQLVREVESQQVVQRASDEFFDFMEKRFMPDVAVRLSADSVERYRDEIGELIERVKHKRKAFKATAERDLRRAAPELVGDPQRSVLLGILDQIEARMHNASAVMLPALRRALNGFTRRADIIMRQLSYAGGGMEDRLRGAMARFRSAGQEDRERALVEAGRALATLSLGLPDADAMRLFAPRRARIVNDQVEEHWDDDLDARRRMFVQSAVDLAFTFTGEKQRDYVIDALSAGHRIHTRDLPIRDARELLMSTHAIELGSALSSEFAFKVTPTGLRARTDFFDATDDFTIELITRQPHAD